MSRRAGAGPAAVPAPALVLAGIVSVQFGGALAATLIALIGPVGGAGRRTTPPGDPV